MVYKAVIAGTTGLIGSILLQILLNEPYYSEVTILVRNKTGLTHKKLTEVVIDFDRLSDFEEEIHGHAIFCCLGTTQRKTPKEADYRKVDHDYPVTLAQLAYKNDVKQYHLVSALGANIKSVTFYTRLKGETEQDIKNVGLNTLHIYQPALLTGNRTEFRPLEKFFSVLMNIVNPLLVGNLKKYRSIPAKTVAMAMYKQSINNDEGTFIHPSDNIKQIA